MKQTKRRLVATLLLVFGSMCGVSVAEVSVGGNSPGKSLVLIYELMGGDDGAPWPIVRTQLPPAWVLNPTGSDGPKPDGWPSLGLDPVTATPEVTWARYDGTDYEIVVSRWQNDQWTTPEVLTDNSVDDQDPELAYAPDGTARITFWSEGQVYWLTRVPSGSWSSPESVDAGVESSTAGSSEDLVAYHRPMDPLGAEILVAERTAGWSPTSLTTTTFAGLDGNGDVDVRLHALSGRVWVDWEDSAGFLGWSVRPQSGAWSPPKYEPISGSEDEEAGRRRIQGHVLKGL